jgi:hypothetical protein
VKKEEGSHKPVKKEVPPPNPYRKLLVKVIKNQHDDIT